MERASKLFVLTSAIAAATLHAILVAREWHELPILLSVGAVLTVVVARRWPSASLGGLVAFGSVAAGACTLAIGRFDWYYPGFPIWPWYSTARTSRRALISGAPT